MREPRKVVVALRESYFQTPLGQFRGKNDPHRQNEQRFQKVLASVREFARHCRTMEPGRREMTPALIPAPRSQERGHSLLCKISYQNLPVGLGNRPDLLRQVDSQTLCLPQTKVWENHAPAGANRRILRNRPTVAVFAALGYYPRQIESPDTGATPPSRTAPN